jgi:2-keto-myo-inositol isomerase
MLSRRSLLASAGALSVAGAEDARMQLCLHQTTSAPTGYRASLEGYARAGVRLVEVIPPHVEAFVASDGMPAARRLLSDLGLKVVSSGGVLGLAEPLPGRAKNLEDLKRIAEMMAALGVDRMVCPCRATATFTTDDYRKGVDNLREAGEIVKPLGIVAMVEFMSRSTFIGTLPTVLRMTSDAAHPNIKPMLDCYHFWAGLSKFEDLDLIHPGEIHHVHFQDTPDIPREMLDHTTRIVPGEGVTPLVRILQKLKEKSYRGALSVELFLPEFQQSDPYEMARRIRASAESVMTRAGVR